MAKWFEIWIAKLTGQDTPHRIPIEGTNLIARGDGPPGPTIETETGEPLPRIDVAAAPRLEDPY